MIRLFQYVKNYKGQVILHLLFTILMVVFSTFSFLMTQPFLKVLFQRTDINIEKVEKVTNVDSLVGYIKYELNEFVITEGQSKALGVLCVLIVLAFFFKNLFRYFAAIAIAPVRFGIIRDLRQQLYDKILSLSLAYFSDERKGDLIGRMTVDVTEVERSVLSMFEILLREPLTLIFSLSIMVYISAKLTIFAFVLMIVVGVVIGGVGKRLKRQSKEVQAQLGKIINILDETTGGLRIIKGFNAINHLSTSFLKENNLYRRLIIIMHWRRDSASPLSEFLGVSIVVILLWYGGTLAFQGHFETEDFLLFILMFYSVIDPAKKISGAYYNIQKGLGAAERVNTILDAQTTIPEITDTKPLENIKTDIYYKNVSFYYEKDRHVLQNIDIKIPKGNIVAFVGSSGAGKSTLADLLPRFYDVTDGEILIDGTNIKEYSLSNLRNLMGIVTQEPILFHDTIFNNIAFGIKNVSRDKVIEAAKIANAHEFIVASENGYETIIGDSGHKLSGGQRQRLTIARAILKNPPILILDEATSSLDSTSEKLVQEALLKLMENRTSIVIAHRLSTIQKADEIIVLQQGKIVERGTHETLLNAKGVYHKLVDLQKI